jgi:trigger factor
VKVTTQELERCEILMTIEADPSQEQDLLQKAARRIAKEVKIPGFRPGKAPYNTILNRFGLEVLRQEVLEQLGEKIITDALQQVNLTPQAPIRFDEITWEPLTIKIKVPGPSKIEVGNYRDLRLEAKTIVVADEDVNQSLKDLQDRHATWTPVERPAQVGDLLTMSVVEKDGDTTLNQSEAVEYELTPRPENEENKDAPDFLTPLVGLSAGESKTFTVNYPENWQAQQYAGKEITFEVSASSVKAKELDPLDDEFAKSVSQVETLDALKDQLRANIEKRRQIEADYELGQQMLTKIVTDAPKIEWAEGLEEDRLDLEMEAYEERVKQAGLTFDAYLKMENLTKDDLREKFRANVVANLKNSLVVGKLVELEKLDVSQSEILERARAIAAFSGGDNRIWQNILASRSQQASIASNLLVDKTLERLAAIAKGQAPALDVVTDAVTADSPQSVAEETPVEVNSQTESE